MRKSFQFQSIKKFKNKNWNQLQNYETKADLYSFTKARVQQQWLRWVPPAANCLLINNRSCDVGWCITVWIFLEFFELTFFFLLLNTNREPQQKQNRSECESMFNRIPKRVINWISNRAWFQTKMIDGYGFYQESEFE